MFGIKTGMPQAFHQPSMGPRPALGMPGIKRGSLPGLGARAMMPHLTGSATPAAGYQDALRQQLLSGLMSKK